MYRMLPILQRRRAMLKCECSRRLGKLLLKNDLFEFLNVQWLHCTGEVDKFILFWREVTSGFYVPKIIKIGSFLTELFKEDVW